MRPLPAMVSGYGIRLALVILGAIGALVQPSIATAAPGPTQRRLAVLELRGAKLEAEILDTFADNVRGGAVAGLAGSGVQVMTRENMVVLLHEMGKNECSEGECEVETARNIGADYVISGAVVRMESVFVVTLKLHETKNGTLLATESVDAPTQIEIMHRLYERSRQLVEHVKARTAVAVRPSWQPDSEPKAWPATPVSASQPGAEDDPQLASIHNHDGFYLRFSLGGAYVTDQLSGMDADGNNLGGSSLGGPAVAFDMAAGGTFGRLVVGGLLSMTTLVSLSAPDSYPRSDYSHAVMFFGGFATYYPDTHKGTNFGGGIGIGGLNITEPTDGSGSYSSKTGSGLGFGLVLMAGHDFWFTDQWSLGAMVRLQYAYGPDDYGVNHSAIAPAILLNALYH